MILGKGVTHSVSTKQKLNTTSSTEAELVAIDDVMGQILWTHHFLAAQWEFVPTTTIYQDNKSTIVLAENGRTSSSKTMRHLSVSYYFVTDQIKKGHVKVAFYPMQNMLADFFMKPLQGALFVHMQEKIFILPASICTNMHRSVLEDRRKKVRLGKDMKATKEEYTKDTKDIKVPEWRKCQGGRRF